MSSTAGVVPIESIVSHESKVKSTKSFKASSVISVGGGGGWGIEWRFLHVQYHFNQGVFSSSHLSRN